MRISPEELESYLWQSAVLLRTHIDASSYKQYIFPLLFFKRMCDVYDEESESAIAIYGAKEAAYFDETHRFKIPGGHHWNDVRNVTDDVGQAIQDA